MSRVVRDLVVVAVLAGVAVGVYALALLAVYGQVRW